ncbi:MAG: response regulator transcription factor [Elusimicrobiales bacterium]|nr:response regulator [Elusimicrobiales bacterium]HOJ85744.1 response regulator [Elusimicrobiales bacterium]HOL62081.1 response regulator [Elusimicrobiales bacterium]HPO94409.1 response regulator [Elusimicrobiales bacterium]
MENKLKLLIADDEMDITELLKGFLSSHGYECEAVTNGKDALNKIKQNKYDLVLLDVMMPYIDGYHVAYEITNQIENPPHIIIMTSRDIQFEKNIAKMSGAAEIIQKPFNLDDMLKLIKKITENK